MTINPVLLAIEHCLVLFIWIWLDTNQVWFRMIVRSYMYISTTNTFLDWVGRLWNIARTWAFVSWVLYYKFTWRYFTSCSFWIIEFIIYVIFCTKLCIRTICVMYSLVKYWFVSLSLVLCSIFINNLETIFFFSFEIWSFRLWAFLGVLYFGFSLN